jgi:hypothetical protein
MNQNRQIVVLDGITWYSQVKYASFFKGRTRKDVNQLIRLGKLETKKHNNHTYVRGYPPASWELVNPDDAPAYDFFQEPESYGEDTPTPAELKKEPKTNSLKRYQDARADNEELKTNVLKAKEEREKEANSEWYLESRKASTTGALLIIREAIDRIPDEYRKPLYEAIDRASELLATNGGKQDGID